MTSWLMKSEPDVFSIHDFARVRRTGWEGVRNYQARNSMRDSMRVGDQVLFYHSNAAPSGVAGLAVVASTGIVDPTQFQKRSPYFDPTSRPDAPRWIMVELDYVATFPHLVTLEQLRREKGLASMPLLQKGQRLSVQPVTEQQFAVVMKLATHAPVPGARTRRGL